MVLIQMLLPTSDAANTDGLAPLAETRRELADRLRADGFSTVSQAVASAR